MLFGVGRVPSALHTFSTLLVAVGTTMSAFWILALNSWMQTPVGAEMRAGEWFPVDWWAIIFNPSMPYRFTHMMLASVLTACFLMMGISAYRLLRGDEKQAPRLALKTAVLVAAVTMPVQVLVGDLHGLNTLEHQPQKIAAIEGIWQTDTRVPLVLFAIPDEEEKTNHFSIEVPGMASLILTHDMNGELKGLEEFEGEHPPVAPVFYAFRIMIGVGISMLLLSWVGAMYVLRQKQWPQWLLKTYVAFSFSGWVATLAGWYVTEIGRQPYLVYGLLKTKDAVTSIAPANIGISLAIYLSVYAVLIVAYVHTLFFMARRAVNIEEACEEEGQRYFTRVLKEQQA